MQESEKLPIVLNFHEQDNRTEITRNFYKQNLINYTKINYCFQGINWVGLAQDREQSQLENINTIESERSSNITDFEKERVKLHSLKLNNDILFQFDRFIKDIQIEPTHPQLKRNVKLTKNQKELVYIRSHGIEKFNIITKKKEFLYIYQNEDLDNVPICFDIAETLEKDFLICLGKYDGNIVLIKISEDQLLNLNQNIEKQFTNFSLFLRKEISPPQEEYQPINSVEFLDEGKRLLICSNDGFIREYDLGTSDLVKIKEFKSKSPVNHCSFNHDNSILVGVGDSRNSEVFDSKNREKIGVLLGHFDFGFSVRFAYNSLHLLATGNQDQSCKLWDLRNSFEVKKSKNYQDRSLKTLYGKNKFPVGDLSFSSDNKFLFFAENNDYVNIHEIGTDSVQSLNFIGTMCGLAFNSRNQKLYVSIGNSAYPGIIVYEKIKGFATSIY